MQTNRLPFVALLTLFAACPSSPLFAQETAVPVSIATPYAVPVAISRADCFPVETLPADLRRLAEVLLKLLDSEALYTIVGGLKPMSGGYIQFYLQTDKPDVANIERTRQALAALRCGDWFRADMLIFRRVGADKKRYLEGAVVYVPAYRRMVENYAPFWATWGITPGTDPFAAIVFAENDDTPARNRALGYLYGYPKPAVDFFVAGVGEKTVTPRDFRQIPTFGKATGQFVYAVPKGAAQSADDIRLRTEAGRILATYKKRRAAYIGGGKPGAVALLRDWFDNGQGQCSPANARYYETPDAP